MPEDTDDTTFVTSETGGVKGQKLARYDQIPTYPLRLLAEHYGKGNAKYADTPDGRDNWRAGYDWNLSYSALQRHINAFWAGEDIDEETGTPHLIAAAWHCFTLVEWSRHPELVEQYDTRQDNPHQDEGPLPSLAEWAQRVRDQFLGKKSDYTLVSEVRD